MCVHQGESKRIQPESSPYVKDEPGPLSSVPGLRGRVQALGLGRSVRQVLLVPVPAWLNVVQIGDVDGRSGVLLILLHLKVTEGREVIRSSSSDPCINKERKKKNSLITNTTL